jgi:S-DNA-T family DNA segregation ATPase FtsK/SpoIIIE
MIDPKMVELSCYKTLPHLMHPVVTDMRKAEAILAWAVDKMEERYGLLARAGVRHISVYNQLGEEELIERLQPTSDEEEAAIPRHLPYIVIVADELADLMMTSGKEVEQHIIRLAQKSRAVGIHLILATQKPTVDVITGLIKSNLPARIAFQVASRTDSRVVLDEMGAERLLGNGDMLFLWPGTSTLLRGQGTYLSDDEINKVVECVSTGEQQFVTELVQLKVDTPGEAGNAPISQRDELYESAVEIVIREGRGSVSLLQRCLGIGYGRAARLIDYMAEDGVVGPYNGSQAREVVMTLTQWQQHSLAGNTGPETTAPAGGNSPSAPAHRIIALHESAPRKPLRIAEKGILPWETEDEDADEEEGDEEYEEEEEYEDDELVDGEDEPSDEDEDEYEDEDEVYEDDEDDEAEEGEDEDEDDDEEEEEEPSDDDLEEGEEDLYEEEYEEVDEYDGPDYEPEEYEYDAQAADGDDDADGEEPGDYGQDEPFDPDKHRVERR